MKTRVIKLFVALTCLMSTLFVVLPVLAEGNVPPLQRVVINHPMEFITCGRTMAEVPPSIFYKDLDIGGVKVTGTVYRRDRFHEYETGGNSGKYCYAYSGVLSGQS